jgi:GAF domain-containing protein
VRESLRWGVTTDIQQQLAERVEEAAGARHRRVQSDPEYRALRKLAGRNRKHPPKTPLDALQHVVDVARELTHGTFGALAVTGVNDYVEGFIVSGMDANALDSLKGPPQGHGPLGTMRQDGMPVRISDVARHAKAFGFPPRHPNMKELLGVPIFAGSDVRGALYVTDRRRGTFTDEDEQMLNVLSRHAGLIIEASWY